MSVLDDPNMIAFLRVIREGEGTQDEDGYRRMFGGELFNSFDDHPRKAITKRLGGKPITSTAAGAFQFLSRTWDECKVALGLTDFTPVSQLRAAVYLIQRRKALDDVLEGRIEDAIRKTNREWASLPGSPYGQPTRTLEQALDTYRAYGGVLRPSSEPAPVETIEIPTEKPMAPFIAAALPAVISAVPELMKMFGSGSEVAERNAKAAEVVVGIAKQAIGARNEQELVETLATEPKTVEVVRQAVLERWFEVQDAGGGGIEGARKADVERIGASDKVRDIFKSHSFVVALVLLPLVYMIVGSLVGMWGAAQWSDDVRAALAGSVVGSVIGGLVGYYFGQTTTRNRAAADKNA